MRWICLLVIAACSKPHAKDVPLRVTHAPACPAGKHPAKRVLLKLQTSSVSAWQELGDKMSAPNVLANESATASLGLEAMDGNGPVKEDWVYTATVTVTGDDKGLAIDLPASWGPSRSCAHALENGPAHAA